MLKTDQEKAERAAYLKEWNLKNAERATATRKAYYEANKVKIAERRKEYISKNKEKVAKRLAEYRKNNIDKVKAMEKAWAIANKEHKASTDKNYRESNKEKVAQTKRIYVTLNVEKVKAAQMAWRNANIEHVRSKSRLIAHVRRARIKGQRLSPGISVKLMALQKSKCANCKASIKNRFHIDHIFPLALGGSNLDDNVQLLCPRCNMRKNAKDPIKWANENGRLL